MKIRFRAEVKVASIRYRLTNFRVVGEPDHCCEEMRFHWSDGLIVAGIHGFPLVEEITLLVVGEPLVPGRDATHPLSDIQRCPWCGAAPTFQGGGEPNYCCDDMQLQLFTGLIGVCVSGSPPEEEEEWNLALLADRRADVDDMSQAVTPIRCCPWCGARPTFQGIEGSEGLTEPYPEEGGEM